ncbi:MULTISPECIES: hypothetical protein [Sinorhizobium]|nr:MULTISPECIES: hypothetical protein [Sinorhizobium]WEJ09447.1 hypothetical protein N0Q90_15235 [Sinorhizobium sp. M103]WEJ16009.1 hypothetical protein N0Q91_05070 [Sinorhizobium sp. K101]WEJ36409.1 hypothetical protein N0R80_15210 [Sinorhizobium sp. C101]GCA51531.1 hypothetical protein KGO5_03981 [Sinorhizobium sp. KGO-5]
MTAKPRILITRRWPQAVERVLDVSASSLLRGFGSSCETMV